jgi:hypothetical protein
MSDDKLAERIYQAAFDRNVLIDRTDCEALAAAARAFIGDEIGAEGDRRHGAQKIEDGRDVCECGADIGPHDPMNDSQSCALWNGWMDAEQFIRGEQR